MGYKWIYPSSVPMEKVEALTYTFGFPPIIAELLVRRGLTEKADIDIFFNPKAETLHDPFLFKDMEKAVNRIQAAIDGKEKVLIFGDYDVDGITSVSVLSITLRDLGAKTTYYIPNRMTEGYGFSKSGVDRAKELGVGLIITVDCGINSTDEINYSRANGIDVIICDHHEPNGHSPAAVAILNPKMEGCTYPNPELAAVGVSFKLAQALLSRAGKPPEALESIFDLAALGTTADVVPLVGENRVLVKQGLARINTRANEGLQTLIKTAGLNKKPIETWHILFGLAPRLNACGRMGDATRGVELLTATDPNIRHKIARDLEQENFRRRREDERILREAMDIIEEANLAPGTKPFVLAREGWHPGVIGVVAARIVEKFHRPAILIACEDGAGRGSARSVEGFDIFQALTECKSYLTEYGGHKYAAGLSILCDNIPAFTEKFQIVSEPLLTFEVLEPKLNIDAVIDIEQIDERLVQYLELFAPFGIQNHRPMFAAHDLRLCGMPRIVSGNHLKLKVKKGKTVLDAIGFNLGEHAYRLESCPTGFSLAFTIDLNTWGGNTSVQLKIKDIQ